MSGQDICNEYHTLVSRAIEVVDKAPHWACIGEEDLARLTIDGETAILTGVSASMEWDCATIDRETYSFPATLLFITDDELAEWKKKEDAAYKLREKAESVQRAADKEASERATLAVLKKKYGG